jgi:hypothetical protein
VVVTARSSSQRLGWLTEVEEATWLAAMPATVVVPADHDAAVAEMLQGIPVPKTFEPSRVPDEGLPTARYQVGANVTGTVACLWFRQWGDAQRSGDTAADEEAVKAMATSRHWAVLHEMDAEGDYPEVLWELAAAMPSGVWTWDGKSHPLLPHAEGLGCARKGIPLLLEKIKAQHERDADARACRHKAAPPCWWAENSSPALSFRPVNRDGWRRRGPWRRR